MSEHSINHLGKVAKQILNVLQKFMEEIITSLNVLKKIPDLLGDLRKDLNSGFNNLIQSHGEMEIYIRMSQVKSKSALLAGETEAIEDFDKQVKEDIEQINKRYSAINKQLEHECKKRIREIDSHLLDFPDKFPKEVYESIFDNFIPSLNTLSKEADLSYKERILKTSEIVNQTLNEIKKFKSIRENFFSHLKKFQSNTSKHEYYIPIWFLGLQDRNSKKETFHTLLPGELYQSKTDNNEKILYSPHSEFIELYESLRHPEKLKEILQESVWAKDKKRYKELEQKAILYSEQNLDRQMQKAFRKALKQSSIKFMINYHGTD